MHASLSIQTFIAFPLLDHELSEIAAFAGSAVVGDEKRGRALAGKQ
jgi:hypothetical protein